MGDNNMKKKEGGFKPQQPQQKREGNLGGQQTPQKPGARNIDQSTRNPNTKYPTGGQQQNTNKEPWKDKDKHK